MALGHRGPWKLIELNTSRYPDRKVQLRPNFMFTPDEVKLYDLVADPSEKKNRAAAEPQRVAEMRRQINQWSNNR